MTLPPLGVAWSRLGWWSPSMYPGMPFQYALLCVSWHAKDWKALVYWREHGLQSLGDHGSNPHSSPSWWGNLVPGSYLPLASASLFVK